jgi:hypothetical protein
MNRPHGGAVETMHATLSDLITDLVQNSIEAEAAEIQLNIEETEQRFNIEITDNGKGMSAETLEKVRDPFYTDGRKHRHRKVGLGLPFLFQTAEMTGGKAEIRSTEGAGTTVCCSLDRRHVDLPAFGNWVTAATTLLTYGFEGELTIRRQRNGRGYTLIKTELEEAVGGLNDTSSLGLLKQFIEGNEQDLVDS